MDRKTEKLARKAATTEGISFSAWVERAVRDNLAAITAPTTEAAP
jgi:predicted HicB family RNase H-like nuclease